jgi:hypothetical protein
VYVADSRQCIRQASVPSTGSYLGSVDSGLDGLLVLNGANLFGGTPTLGWLADLNDIQITGQKVRFSPPYK